MKPLLLAVLFGTVVLVDRVTGVYLDDDLQLPPLTMDIDSDGHMAPSLEKDATDRPLLGRPDGHDSRTDNSPLPPAQQTERPVIGRPDGHDEHGHSDEDLMGRPDGHDEHGHSDEDLMGRPDGHDEHGHSDEDLMGRPDGHDEHGHSDEDLLGRPDGHDGFGLESEEQIPDEPDSDDGEEPLVRCKRPLCMIFCSFGFQTDANGCPACQCLEDPCQDFECRDGTVCHPVDCESTRSCVKLSAECIPSRNCPEPMCANYCPNGYAHNAEGCMTCTCESQDESPPPPESIGKEEDFPCPEVMCATYCPTGYQRNERGCSTCTCNNGTVNDPSCGDVFCELGQVCRRTDSKSYCAPKPMCLLSQEMAHMKRDRPTGTRMFVPECEDDGTFKPKQCHSLVSQCWCVDDRGKEIDSTRIAVKLGEEEDQLHCKPNVSLSVHMEMTLAFQDLSDYGDEEYDDEEEDYEKELGLNLDKSQGTLESAFSEWLLVERQYVTVVKVEQNTKTTVFVQLEVRRGESVDLPSAVEHMKRKIRMGHCTVQLGNIPEQEEVYFAPNPDTLSVEHQYNTEQQVMTDWPEQGEAFDGRGWYKYCFGDYHILLAVATMLVLFMILALFSAVMVHRHRRNHRSLQFRHHKLENQLSHEQKNFMEGEVAGDTQSDSTVILVSADALEKKHPIA